MQRETIIIRKNYTALRKPTAYQCVRQESSSSYVALQHFYRVFAFSTNSFHLLLSWARVLQFGIFIFCVSFLTSSPQRVFGLPIGLLDMGFQACPSGIPRVIRPGLPRWKAETAEVRSRGHRSEKSGLPRWEAGTADMRSRGHQGEKPRLPRWEAGATAV